MNTKSQDKVRQAGSPASKAYQLLKKKGKGGYNKKNTKELEVA